MSDELEYLQQRIEGDEELYSEENREERIGHNRWCLCGRCPLMATAKESVCCTEIRKATDKMGLNVCITTHPSFEQVWRRKFCELFLLPGLMCALTIIRTLSNCGFSDWLLTGNLPGGLTANLADQFDV